MLVLDGMPGCGKTTRLGALRRQCPDAVVFPEAQPPDGADEHAVLRALMGEDYARTQAARQLAEHEPHCTVASDRSHLGVLAYRYAHARLTGSWADFEHALTYTSVLDQRHHDDIVLILHLDPAESVRRRGDPAASADRFWPWFDSAFLRAYGEFWYHLDQWVTLGPRWSHHHADDPAVDATLRALLSDAPRSSAFPRQSWAGNCRAAAIVSRPSR